MPGPMPKRIEERRRRNAVPGETTVAMDGQVAAPSCPSNLHPAAAAWFESLKLSGHSAFYEPSDWAAAVYVAEAMSVNLNQPRLSAQLFAQVWAAMGDLLSTEKERRKARIQVQRDIDDASAQAGPTAIDKYRAKLGG